METVRTIEQEIAELQHQIEQKKAQLEQGVQAPEQMPSHEEVVRQTVGERFQQQAPSFQPPAAPAPAAPANGPSYQMPELIDAIAQLHIIADSKGLDEAIKMAESAKNPALLDAFHDYVVDMLMGNLVAGKKVPLVE